jgi:phenylacetate-CoA ligase
MLLRANFSGWEVGESLLQTGMSPQRGMVRALKDRVLRTTYVPAFNLSDRSIDELLEIIERKRIYYVMGYAASLYLIAGRAKDVGFNRTLKGVVSWGDMMFTHYRRRIEAQFGCRVTDTYGCGEGIQVAAQCGHAEGSYHIFTPHVAVEFVREGAPVAPGEPGDVLLTRLDAGATPLIRYQVGDVGRSDPRDTCACGRGLPLMKGIDGRATDIVVTPRGNRLIVHFFTGIMEYARHIDSFQVVQEQVDRITIKVVPKGQFDREEWARLECELREKGDPDLQIDLEVVDEIPLEGSNKRRFVVSKVAR